MVMVVDITEAKDTFDETAEKLYAVGGRAWDENQNSAYRDFDAMHRI